MKDNIGFITVGQAGGNIGTLLVKQGYNVLFTNTSPEDLATLKGAIHVYHIKGGEGCNKDRNKAKDLVIADFNNISKEVEQKIQEEYVFVIFSSGGGTGSGASPMLIELLIQYSNKKVGAITILPAQSETFKTAINAYECFTELEKIDGMGATFIPDNGKANKFSINRDFVALFTAFLDIPKYQNFKGNIDIAEIKELLSTRGAAIISKLAKTNGDTAQLIKSFTENIFAPMQGDHAVKYMGLSAPSHFDIEAIEKEIGVCLDVFQGHNPEHTVCMLAGLTFPYITLDKMKARVDDNREAINKSLIATSERRLSDGINFLATAQEKKETNPKVNPADIFAKYKSNK